MTKLSRQVLDEGGKKEKHPEDMKEMQNERQTTILWTHKSWKPSYLNHKKLKHRCSNLIIPAL